MNYEIINQPINNIQADLELIFILGKNLDADHIQDKSVLERMKFEGDDETVAYLPESGRIYAGLENLRWDVMADTAAAAMKKAQSTNAKSLKVAFYGEQTFKSMIDGLVLGEYVFDKYKSKQQEKILESVLISTQAIGAEALGADKMKTILKETLAICESVNFTRDIINAMPEEVMPVRLAEIAEAMAKEAGIECKVFDENYLKENGMNAFHAVGRASVNPPRLIHLTYRAAKPKAKIVLVGKGLTYDSGGLSLKPGDFMTTMKSDKSGASAVLGIIKAVAELKLDVELHAIVGAAENMIGGNAYKPDDVLVSKSGKTIEVKNTDAEGRLVLADCLTYAQELQPDYLFDMATLTGACVVALGEYTTGVMGHSDELKASMVQAGEKGGELAAVLPFNKYLKKLIKGEVADINNTGANRYGGAITAGLFLSEFIEEEYKDKWLHLDIAGPAYVEKAWGCNPYGASGAGVRMVTEWIRSKA